MSELPKTTSSEGAPRAPVKDASGESRHDGGIAPAPLRSETTAVERLAGALSEFIGEGTVNASYADAFQGCLARRGLAVVPVEPTDIMLVAGKNSEWGWRDEPGKIDCRAVWAAMVEASDGK